MNDDATHGTDPLASDSSADPTSEPLPTALSPEMQRRVAELADRVIAIARHLAPTMPQVQEDDLISAGNEGLVRAALRYDPDSDVPFAAFAHYRIRGAMIDHARRTVPSVRRRTRAQRAMEATQAVLEQAQREQSALDAQATRSLEERVQAAADVVAQATAAIMLTKLARVDPDRLPTKRMTDAEDEILGAELSALLERAVEDCPEEDKALLDALYFQGMSMHDLSKASGKSVSTISRRHARLMRRLGSRLRNRLER